MISAFLLVAAVVLGDSTAAAGSHSAATVGPDSAAALSNPPIGATRFLAVDSTVPRPRARAIQISDSYGWKFRTHRIGSYLIVPLFAAQYAMGSQLLSQKEDVYLGRRKESVNPTLRKVHLATAIGVGTVFLANTATGAMLMYENRSDPHNRALKITHTALMLIADAGFAATGVMGRRALEETPAYARRHRQVALSSIGVATVGAAMMWVLNR
jgi:hypothetical protein